MLDVVHMQNCAKVRMTHAAGKEIGVHVGTS